MQINWAEFSLDMSFLVGILIVVAALLMMLANGFVMGVSSILGGLLGKAETKNWRLEQSRSITQRQRPDLWQKYTKKS